MLPEICSFEQLCRLVQIFSPDGALYTSLKMEIKSFLSPIVCRALFLTLFFLTGSIHGPLPVINKSSAALLLVNCTVHSYYLELALIKKYIYN